MAGPFPLWNYVGCVSYAFFLAVNPVMRSEDQEGATEEEKRSVAILGCRSCQGRSPGQDQSEAANRNGRRWGRGLQENAEEIKNHPQSLAAFSASRMMLNG